MKMNTENIRRFLLSWYTGNKFPKIKVNEKAEMEWLKKFILFIQLKKRISFLS